MSELYPPPYVYPAVAEVFNVPLIELLNFKWERWERPWQRGGIIAHAVYTDLNPVAELLEMRDYYPQHRDFGIHHHSMAVKEVGLMRLDKRHQRTWFYLYVAICSECRVAYWGNFEKGNYERHYG